ncbi:MAG: hypothetical protein FWG63_12405, partial [Defluviitaleaceae bacterium]|nr:hypothetical protein [Defluviitaleaceae bacterium]
VALELADEVRKAAAPNELVNDTLDNKWNLEDFRKLVEWYERKAARSAEQKGEAVGMEKMIITAIKNSVPLQAVEAMCRDAGITEARLVELKNQAQMA